jgi:hypothetical protein
MYARPQGMYHGMPFGYTLTYGTYARPQGMHHGMPFGDTLGKNKSTAIFMDTVKTKKLKHT